MTGVQTCALPISFHLVSLVIKIQTMSEGVVVRGQDLQVRVEVRGGFIRIRGAHFVMNGSPYYANGFNAYLADVFGS